MDSGNSNPRSNNLIIPVAIAALIVLAVIGYYLYSNNTSSNQAETANAQTTTTDSTTETTKGYKDGQYEAAGNYVSPGGPREIKVMLTLADGKVTDTTFVKTENADPTSQRFQGEFAEGYKTMVVGKSLDEVNLTKVAGSSLTPKGFMDALSKIKTDAQS